MANDILDQLATTIPSTSGVRSPRQIELTVVRDVNTRYTKGVRKLSLENAEAVNNEIINLLTTVRANPATGVTGELCFEPTFGTNLASYLQKPVSDLIANLIRNEVIQAVKRWIPRVTVDVQNTLVLPTLDGKYYEVYLTYNIARTRENGSLKFTLTNPNAN